MNWSAIGAAIATVMAILPAHASDQAIDRLLSKLPPPQKFVDPASNDPLAKEMSAAIKAHNLGIALDRSRRLAKRYPKSLAAWMANGALAASLHKFSEASAAYHKALSIRADFPPAYVGLGLIDVSQGRFAAGLANFQKITRIAPQLDVGWVGSSVCAEKLGRKRESLEFARRAAAVAPSSVGAWLQLARMESAAGNRQAASNALNRAIQLQRSARRSGKK
jgi:tetratricopeptide (TPR) repeat protein